MADDGIIGFGATLTSDGTIAAVGQLVSLTAGGGTVTFDETTTMASTGGWRTKLACIKDAGTIDVEVKYEQSEISAIMGDLGTSPDTWTITFSDATNWICDGFISSNPSVGTPLDGVVTASFTIELTGVPTCTV